MSFRRLNIIKKSYNTTEAQANRLLLYVENAINELFTNKPVIKILINFNKAVKAYRIGIGRVLKLKKCKRLWRQKIIRVLNSNGILKHSNVSRD
ncbi:MAG: hypothetical protein LBG21_05650 [Campylobacteraceae bacterium]|jgi:hypothetical protein|nr:hypothetical protein [Campylobacteraceae bacterium]